MTTDENVDDALFDFDDETDGADTESETIESNVEGVVKKRPKKIGGSSLKRASG